MYIVNKYVIRIISCIGGGGDLETNKIGGT